MGKVVATELVAASKILFGSQGPLSEYEIPGLAEVKAAYRKKVKMFHPDMAARSSMSRERLQAIFLKISDAYEILVRYWDEDAKEQAKRYSVSPFGRADRFSGAEGLNRKLAAAKRGWKGVRPNVPIPVSGVMTADYYYRGEIPKRKLRFGEFLFYTGRIDWKTFMAALVYQCQKRPLIGAVCVEAGFLDEAAVDAIMEKRKLLEGEKFGEAAVRLHYLTKHEINRALRKQYAYGQPFGKYFTDEGIFTQRTLQRLLSEFHNWNFQVSLKIGCRSSG